MTISPIEAASRLVAPNLFDKSNINVISIIASKVLPDIISLCHMRSTCKSCFAVNITELQRQYFTERYPMLAGDLFTQYKGIKSNELKLYTQGDFIFKWCGSSHPLARKIRSIPVIDGTPVNLEALVKKGDYVAAFAIAACVDGPQEFFDMQSNPNSQIVQKTLIEKWGYKKALQITLNLSGEESRANAYLAFIQVGCQGINLPRPTSLAQLQEIREHAFMLALQGVQGSSDIPILAVSCLINHLLHRAIGNICYDPEMSTDDELSDENDETAPRKEIVRKWLSFIPKERFLFGLKQTTDLSWKDMSGTFHIFLELKDITDEDFTNFIEQSLQ